MKEGFPNNSGLSTAVVVFERTDSPLSRTDYAAIEAIAARVSIPSELASATDLASKNILQPIGSQGKDVVGVWRVEEQSGYPLPV